jgi:hypothetical protein
MTVMEISLKMFAHDNVSIRFNGRLIRGENSLKKIRLVENAFLNLLGKGKKCIIDYAEAGSIKGVIRNVEFSSQSAEVEVEC